MPDVNAYVEAVRVLHGARVALVLREFEHVDLVGGGQDALLQEAPTQQRIDDRRLSCSPIETDMMPPALTLASRSER